MTTVLDAGGLLLARLPKGTLGEETAQLLGSFLVAATWQAAAPRARLPEHARPDAALYVDECHNFLNLPYPLEDMLAEARAYRLSVVMAHQNLAQLPPDLREGHLRQRPQPGHLHRQPRGRPHPRTPHPASAGRPRPVPPGRLPGRRPARRRRRRAPPRSRCAPSRCRPPVPGRARLIRRAARPRLSTGSRRRAPRGPAA